MINMKRRQAVMAVIVSIILLATAGFAGVTSYAVMSQYHTPKPPGPSITQLLARIKQVPLSTSRWVTARRVPVLVYHEMNNGCPATGITCPSHDRYTVSATQFRTEMDWMYQHGYHTVTLTQYLAWLRNGHTLLPSHPFLLTDDNGIANFLEGAQPVLWHYRYTAVAFVVTGFADGIAGHCAPRINGVNVQPGCPQFTWGWDATWAQLRDLSPKVWSFGMEAGASGHYDQAYDKNCGAFDACKLPGETSAAYERRVQRENSQGIAELTAKLGARYNSRAWVVPYSDLGYKCLPYSCAYEHSTGPRSWLVSYAASHFSAVFVQDYYRNGVSNERFRYEIHNMTTVRQFRRALAFFLSAGGWNRT